MRMSREEEEEEGRRKKGEGEVEDQVLQLIRGFLKFNGTSPSPSSSMS